MKVPASIETGARLSLPLSDTAPFTLKAGSPLSGAGEFLGTYRFASGAVFDVTDGIAENVRKTTVLTFDECAVDENATWTVRGASTGATVIVDTVKKLLVVKQQLGAVLIVR